ncbi:RRP12-like protein, partial [Trifolium medium]|nr:RRP12-like protein [Trifolium medium]
MEGIELNESTEDLRNTILSEFGNSTNQSHQYLCSVIGCISQVIKRHNLPSSPVVYLAYTISSLKIISTETNPDNLLFNVLLTIFSLVIVKVPVDVVRKTREFSSELVVTVIVFPSISE